MNILPTQPHQHPATLLLREIDREREREGMEDGGRGGGGSERAWKGAWKEGAGRSHYEMLIFEMVFMI